MKTHDQVIKALMKRPGVRAAVDRVEREETGLLDALLKLAERGWYWAPQRATVRAQGGGLTALEVTRRCGVAFRYHSPFDRLVRPDALRATSRLRAALSFVGSVKCEPWSMSTGTTCITGCYEIRH